MSWNELIKHGETGKDRLELVMAYAEDDATEVLARCIGRSGLSEEVVAKRAGYSLRTLKRFLGLKEKIRVDKLAAYIYATGHELSFEVRPLSTDGSEGDNE